MELTSPFDIVELVRPHLRPELDNANLTFGVVIVCVLLAVCAFTDVFRDRRIPNVISVGMIVAALAATPLLFANPWVVVANAAALFTLQFILALATGGIGLGDVKLYTALTLLLGPAGWLLYFLSQPVGLLYGLPLARAQKRGSMRKSKVPMAPAIAVSFPLTLAALGLPAGQACFLAILQAATFGLIVAFDRFRTPLHERTVFYDDLPIAAGASSSD